MATEPERKIEQLLKAYAQKRRDEAGEQFALHPANRRLLQAEVARLRSSGNSGQASSSWLQIFSQLWVRVGLAFSILLLLGGVLWVMHPGERANQQMAKASPSKALETRSKDTLGRAPAKDQERVASSPALATPAPAPAKEISLADGAQNAPVDNLKSSSLEKRKALREEPSKAEIADRAKLEALSKGVAESPGRSAGTAGLAAVGEQKKADLPAVTTAPAPAPAQPPTMGQDYFFRQQAKARDEAQAAPKSSPESSPALAQADKLQQSQPATPAAPQIGGRMGGYGGGGFGGGNYRANFGDAGQLPAEAKRDADTAKQLAGGQGPAAGAQDSAASTLLRQSVASGTAAPLNQKIASQALSQTNALFAQSQMGREAERRLTENEALQRPSSATAAKAPAAKPALTLAPAQSSREQFAALPGMGSGSPAALSSFVVERSGNQVRLIDADGSIYEGQLLAQAGDELQPELKQRVDSATKGIAKDSPKLGVEVTRRARMATTSPALSFRASGLNRTLNQRVEIQASIGSPAALPQPTQGMLAGGIVAGRAFPARGYASSPAATTPPPPGAPSVVPPGPQQAGSRSTLSSAPASNTVLLQGTATTATGQQIPIQAARLSATK